MTEISPLGSHALLLSDAHVMPARLARLIGQIGMVGLRDAVPAAATTTLVFDRTEDRDLAWAMLLEQLPGLIATDADLHRPVAQPSEIELRCRFDGPDLTAVGELTGLGATGVIEALTTTRLEVAFCGFSPGFAYLEGLPTALHLPRRSRPRSRVEAGSVAIAARYAAVYPSASPGGWHLLGSTDAPLWHVEREPPALLSPGSVVRFIDVTAGSERRDHA